MSIFTKFWALIVKIGHAFATKVLPVAIEVTQDINEAVKSGDAQKVVDVLEAVNPTAGHIAQEILDEGKVLAPKVLASELGLQALEGDASLGAKTTWVESLLEAYGSADFIKKTRVWNSLAVQLAVLYDQGETTNKTWADWSGNVEKAFQDISAAVKQAQSGDGDTTQDPVQDPPVESNPTGPQPDPNNN